MTIVCAERSVNSAHARVELKDVDKPPRIMDELFKLVRIHKPA